MDYRHHRPGEVGQAVVDRFRASMGRPVAETEEDVVRRWACEAYATAALLDGVLKGTVVVTLVDGKPAFELAKGG